MDSQEAKSRVGRGKRQQSRPCHCGSGLASDWLLDDQGDELARVCGECRERVAFAYDAASSCNADYDDETDFDEALDRLVDEDADPLVEDEP
jgi:hypothetical protein